MIGGDLYINSPFCDIVCWIRKRHRNGNALLNMFVESREHCVVIGGLEMNGKEVDVNVSNLTLRKSRGYGVRGYYGASMHLDNVSVEKF